MLLALLAGCPDQNLGTYSTPPVVAIISPETGAAYDPGTLVEFYGEVSDRQTDPAALALTWSSDLDGELGTDPSDGDGNVYFATSSLSSGTHTLTLTAVDEHAEATSASIALTVHPGSTDEPTVVLLSPAEGDEYYASDVVNVIATVTDGEDAYAALAVELIDVPDGTLWTGNPSEAGAVSQSASFSVGDHTLSLSAVDSDGNVAVASVGFTVLDDGRPRVSIDVPSDGDTFDNTDVISFQGTVSDDITAVDVLGITWASDVDGTLSTSPADSSGATSTSATLSAGVHTITLTALDEEAKTGSDSIVLTVEDPLARDDDGDGYSENDGDCDDTDAQVSPGEAEICDDVDNDCDGYVNEDWWDGYEPNDSMGSPYDCGEVDSSTGWSNSTLDLSALTLSAESDEDWFTWDADDDWYDNITVTVSASGFSARGTYVIEVYDGDGNIRGSDSGSGSMAVEVEGDVFDEDEDTWYVRVYASTWPTESCDVTYDLRIHS